MTRVSTLSQNQFILSNTLAAQERLVDLRRQVSTGNKADRYQDLGTESLSLAVALSRISRAEQYQANNDHAKSKLDMRETAVREIGEITKGLKAEFLQAEGLEDARQLQVLAENSLARVVAILNSQDQNGNYMFGGSRTNIPPVALVANGAPPPNFTYAFSNDQVIEQARIDEGLVIDIGVVAGADATTPSASFQGLFDVLNYLGSGRYPPPVPGTPLLPQPGNPPTVGAAALVTGVIDAALSDINQLNADIGIKQNIVNEVNIRLQEQVDLTAEFVGVINDADMAEALTLISQQQVALEASFRITGDLRNLSLVNFI
jgi:flagellar hook-associated protein 3 FlgL